PAFVSISNQSVAVEVVDQSPARRIGLTFAVQGVGQKRTFLDQDGPRFDFVCHWLLPLFVKCRSGPPGLTLWDVVVSGRALNPSHPGGGFRTFISSGRVDQNQAITASIGRAPELILVLHDEVKGLGQLFRGVSILEASAPGM